MAKNLTSEQRVTVEAVAWEMRTRGRRLTEIAQALADEPYHILSETGEPLPKQTIHAALARVQAHVQSRLQETAEIEAIIQLEQLGLIQEEAMDAWERSKGQARTVTQRRAGPGGDVEYTTRIQEQAGEAAYLRTAMTAMEARRKILGIDGPQRYLDVSSMSDDELRRLIRQSRGRAPV